MFSVIIVREYNFQKAITTNSSLSEILVVWLWNIYIFFQKIFRALVASSHFIVGSNTSELSYVVGARRILFIYVFIMKTFVFEIMQAVVPKISFQKCVENLVFLNVFYWEKIFNLFKVHFVDVNCATRNEIRNWSVEQFWYVS